MHVTFSLPLYISLLTSFFICSALFVNSTSRVYLIINTLPVIPRYWYGFIEQLSTFQYAESQYLLDESRLLGILY